MKSLSTLSEMYNTQEYLKQVLSKVSFDKDFFLEVLCESIISLDKEDLNEMKCWCLSEFGPEYVSEIRNCFDSMDQRDVIQEFDPILQKRLIRN